MSRIDSRSIAFVACINDEAVFQDTLARSDAIIGFGVTKKRGYASASKAYNEYIDETDADHLVFLHQDVYLPRSWTVKVNAAIAAIEQVDPNWAVLGLSGKDEKGRSIGHVWSAGMHTIVGEGGFHPTIACSVDELLIIVRRDSRVRFDDNLAGFHLYGTDIVQSALTAGKKSYIIDAPVIHNSRPVKSYFGAFWAAYLYLRIKWWEVLPIASSCTTISRSSLGHLKMATLHKLRRSLTSSTTRHRRDVRLEAERLGFER